MSEPKKSRAEIRLKKLHLSALVVLALILAAVLIIDPAEKETVITQQNSPTSLALKASHALKHQKPNILPKRSKPNFAKSDKPGVQQHAKSSNIKLIPSTAATSPYKSKPKKIHTQRLTNKPVGPQQKPQISNRDKKVASLKKSQERFKTTDKKTIKIKTTDIVSKNQKKRAPKNNRSTKFGAKKSIKPIAKAGAKQKNTSKARVTSLSFSEKTANDDSSTTASTFSTQPSVQNEPYSDDYVETAFDLFVGGNYYGFVMLKYNDNWIEILNPQEAIALLPLIRNRQTMLPLFAGLILDSREIPELGSLTVDYNNFAINVTIAPEQALQVKVDKKKGEAYEGSPTFLMRMGVKGNKPIDVVNDSSRFSFTNSTRFAYNQYRVLTSGNYSDFDSEYKLDTFQGEADFSLFEEPLTAAAGLIDVPGQMFASSVNIYGMSLFTNHKLYARDPLLSSNEIEVFVPTRALVEIFKNDSENGVVLYSRMHDFGHTQIDTTKFPRGSYPVVIVVSVDGIERARYTEQFYKYEEILPRETLDINLTYGNFRDNLDQYNLPVFYGSVRTRISHDLEGSFSIYTIDSRTIFSQSIKKIFSTENLGEFTFSLTLSESNSKSLLGFSTDLRWRGETTSATLYFSKSFSDLPIYQQDIEVISFQERETLNINISRNFTIFNRSLNCSFKGQYRDDQYTGVSYRYGPLLRFIPYRGKRTSIILTAQHDWTKSGEETRFQANLTYRYDPVTVGSNYNTTYKPLQQATSWQHYVQYTGNEKSSDRWKNLSAKAVYNNSKTEHDNGIITENQVSNYNVSYDGSSLQASGYLNKSSGEQGGYFGGEVLSTLVAGSNDLVKMAGSVPIGSGIIAISLLGDIDDAKLISVMVNGNHKAYINTGEIAFIEAPVYKTSKIEIRDANPKKGAFIKIIDPFTEVTPYPGNIVHRSFEIAKLAIISGTLLKQDGSPVASLFFETGYEPAYTDSDGNFIVEMPIRFSEKQFDFIARDQLCTFEIAKVPEDSLVEVGNVSCRLANDDELRLVRAMHDETRIYD
ncbi:MAG: hypothetical protein D6B28_06750 [Gammaproteobacteria bacterium]|nr:MAG: hypothetical protein D6B28_06750 [Gammaproteobacteria bacterium]